MKRFIRYLYEYENGKRTRNVGFVKVESGSDETMIHIHGKGFHMDEGSKLVLYLFYEENGKCIGIWQAETDNATPVISYHLRYTANDTGTTDNYDKIGGIILESGCHRRYAAVWEETLVDISRMQIWEPEEVGNGLTEMEVIEDIAEEPQIKVTKIKRADISKFPRCEWHLANNHFLMHGYYNYRHLALIDTGELCKIGVPGVYHEKEEKAAKSFGFGEFLPIKNIDIVLEPEENNEEEKFGYWCRQVRNCQAKD